MKLRGGIALVTNAADGIGAEIAVRLAYEGMSVAITANDALELEATAGRIFCASQDALAIAADFADLGEREHLMTRINDDLGHLDLLVNTDGMEANGEGAEKIVDRVIRVAKRSHVKGSAGLTLEVQLQEGRLSRRRLRRTPSSPLLVPRGCAPSS